MRAVLSLALLLAACGHGPGKEPPGNQPAEVNALAAEVDQMEGDIRLRQLEKRMDALEMRMGNVTLRDADIDALETRVRAVEAAEAGQRLKANPTPAP